MNLYETWARRSAAGAALILAGGAGVAGAPCDPASGMFDAPAFFELSDRPRLTVIADFNGDGVDDVAAMVGSSDAIAVRLGNGAGGFHPEVTTATGNISNLAARSMAAWSRR